MAEKVAMVICSTENQIVNYIGLEYYQNQDKYTIDKLYIIDYIKNSAKPTGGNSEQEKVYRFDQQKWNDNLNKVIEANDMTIEIYPIHIEQDDSIQHVEDKLGDALEGIETPIIWNLTGGQRYVTFACQEYIKNYNRSQDIYFYLEGNNNNLHENKCEQWSKASYTTKLELTQVLSLAGFHITNKRGNLLQVKWDNQEHQKKCLSETKMDKLVEAYVKNGEFRTQLIETLTEKKWETVDFDSPGLGDCKEELFNNLINARNNKDKAFGYLLEYMTLYKIYNYIMHNNEDNYFVDLRHSLNVSRYARDINDTKYNYCELDIVIMTSTGQLCIIECKGGSMPSSIGKSRQMTVYAVGGVYGMPILVTPLIGEEIAYKRISETEKTYQYIQDATNAAMRIGLDIWSLDNIEDNLKRFFNRK